jgi:hypothetical protein
LGGRASEKGVEYEAEYVKARLVGGRSSGKTDAVVVNEFLVFGARTVGKS